MMINTTAAAIHIQNIVSTRTPFVVILRVYVFGHHTVA
jgi:hypothetical protein